MAISFSKDNWVNTLTTMQRRAGQYAGVTADGERCRTAVRLKRINSLVCPTFIYNDRSWDWSSRTTTIVQAADTRSEEERAKDKDDKRAASAALIGAILMIVGSALVGYTYYNWNSQRTALNETEKAQKAYTNVDGTIVNIFGGKTDQLGSLLNAVEALDRNRMIKANKLLCLATVFIAGAAMMTVGGFTTSMTLVTAGQITAVAATAIGAAVLMYHWFADGELTLQAREITRRSGQLIDHLRERDGKLEERLDSPPPYSLYPHLPEAEEPPPTYSYWTDRSPPSYHSPFLPGHSQATYDT